MPPDRNGDDTVKMLIAVSGCVNHAPMACVTWRQSGWVDGVISEGFAAFFK